MSSLALNTNFVKTMSSRQIAEVVDKRHDNVKRTIETLAKQGVVQLPQIEEVKNHLGQAVQEYQVNERDSYIVVAQLCPEYTAKLVDYWMATKNNLPTLPNFTDPAEAAIAWASEYKAKQFAVAQVAQLETTVSELQPKANALDSLANATGQKTITNVAKVLGVQPEKFLRPWMLAHRWIHTATDGQYHACAERIRAGHLKEKDRLVTHKSGTQEVKVTVYVTPKGEALLAQRLADDKGEAA
jgi:phage regulator Rha-like protein